MTLAYLKAIIVLKIRKLFVTIEGSVFMRLLWWSYFLFLGGKCMKSKLPEEIKDSIVGRGIFILLGFFMLIIISSMEFDTEEPGMVVVDVFFWVLSIAVFLFGCIGLYLDVKRYKQQQEEKLRAKIELEKRLERERKEKEQIEKDFDNLCASGKWSFSLEEFYKKCAKQNIENLDDNFYLSKAKLLLDNMLKEDKVSKKYWDLYDNEEKLKEYFVKGKTTVENIELKKKNTPVAVRLSKSEKEEQTFLNSLKSENGIKKRKKILNRIVQDGDKRLQELRKGKQALNDLAIFTIQSAHTQSKQDWATIGGIASAIGGPTAGLVAAQQAIIENERIEVQNQRNKEYASSTASSYLNTALDVSNEEDQMIEFLKPYKSLLKKTDEILVLDGITTLEIFEELKIVANISGNKLKLDIVNTYIPDVPKEIKIVADGTLNVKISCDSIFVDEIIVPFSLMGILCDGGNGVCYNYLNKKLPGNREYDFEISPVSLWLMEE